MRDWAREVFTTYFIDLAGITSSEHLISGVFPVSLQNDSHLKDVDGGLVDGAGDGAARIDDIADRTHHDCRCPCIQTWR